MSKASEFIRLIDEQRGQGQGVGGPRQGDGGASTCKCPKCGYTMEHDRGTPCSDINCPKCGTKMEGTDEEDDEDDEGVAESKKNSVTITKGISTLLNKLPKSHLVCSKCGFEVPKYRGHYPTNCPKCGTPLSALSHTEELSQGILV